MPPDATEQRKLAAIMFTDMVGYSALTQRDEELALELLDEHRPFLRVVPRIKGTEIKTIGEAFLVEFDSAVAAAQCAIEIQGTLARRDLTARRPPGPGANRHSPWRRRASRRRHHGDGVNIASRIEPLAGPGGICVSMDVERQIRNALEARFEKLAPTELKNISVPMDLFRIVLPWERPSPAAAKCKIRKRQSDARTIPKQEHGEGRRIFAHIPSPSFCSGWLVRLSIVENEGAINPRRDKTGSPAQTKAATIPEKSIAVLPFENLSSDPDNAYFADGIQDEILTRLSKIADLKVISRTSTQHYKSAPENLPEIARQLGVAHILEGSVQKSGDAVRVNVQLIKAANDSHLWADTFDRKLTDIFSVESEVAKAIAEQLRAKLPVRKSKSSLPNRPTILKLTMPTCAAWLTL